MDKFYEYFIKNYLYEKDDYEKLIKPKEVSIDYIVSAIYDASYQYCSASAIYENYIIEKNVKEYIYINFLIESLQLIAEREKNYINKREFARNYLIPDKIKEDESSEEYNKVFDSRYRNINRHKEGTDTTKITNFQIPYLGYHIQVTTDKENKEQKRFYKSLDKDSINEVTLSTLQKYFNKFIDFINKSDEKYKNISFYFCERKFMYSTIIAMIDKIKKSGLKKTQKEYWYFLYDLILVFGLQDINLRAEAVNLYSIENREDFIKETLYISNIYYSIIDSCIKLCVYSLDKEILKEIVKKDEDNINNKEKGRYEFSKIIGDDEGIYKDISNMYSEYYLEDVFKDMIKLQYEYEKSAFDYNKRISRELSDFENYFEISKFNKEIKFLCKTHFYNRSLIE